MNIRFIPLYNQTERPTEKLGLSTYQISYKFVDISLLISCYVVVIVGDTLGVAEV